MHLSFNTKMLLFAGRLLGRFRKKHNVRRSTTSSTPGGTRHLEVGRSSYEVRKIREQKWDPQGTFGENDFRQKKGLHHCTQKAQNSWKAYMGCQEQRPDKIGLRARKSRQSGARYSTFL